MIEEINSEVAEKLGLSKEEYGKIIKLLGRKPNRTELKIYSQMWSEDVSSKNSIKWLKTLPETADYIESGTRLIDIGDNQACMFNIESHNHLVAENEYYGTATSIGSIVRSIYSRGATPIAQMHSLRFGCPDHEKVQTAIKQSINAVCDYGNTLEMPVVGVEASFNATYLNNPLVNVMAVGFLDKNEIQFSPNKNAGNSVIYVGSPVDKIDLKNTADSYFNRNIAKEKELMDLTFEMLKTQSVVAIQNISNGGIIGALPKLAVKTKKGIKIEIEKIPLANSGLSLEEIIQLETFPRLLFVLDNTKQESIERILINSELNYAYIGTTVDNNEIEITSSGETKAKMPINSLIVGKDAPYYDQYREEPNYIEKNQTFSIFDIEEPENLRDVADFLLKHHNVSAKHWLIEQFDERIDSNNLRTNYPSDASLVTIQETNKILALVADCNASHVKADPETGLAISVAEAYRKIICSGGEPLAICTSLNFGSPHDKEVYWQFVGAINGLKSACEVYKLPVIHNSVSFNNQYQKENQTKAIHPAPIIGMLGIIKNKHFRMSIPFKHKGDMIFMVGEARNDIASSEYLSAYLKVQVSPAPYFDINYEFEMQKVIYGLIEKELIRSAHQIGNGGLYIALVECGMVRGYGFDITTDAEIREDAFLFGEAQGRVVVSVEPRREADFIDFMMAQNFPFSTLGHVTKGEMRVDDVSYGFIDDAKKIYETTFKNLLSKNTE